MLESPVSGLFPLSCPLVFKIKQIQKCKTKPFWDNEWKEAELRAAGGGQGSLRPGCMNNFQ